VIDERVPLAIDCLAHPPGKIGQRFHVLEIDDLAVVRIKKNQLPPQETSPVNLADGGTFTATRRCER